MFFLFAKNLNKNAMRFACQNTFIGVFVIFWQLILIFIPIFLFSIFKPSHYIYTFFISFFFILFNGTRMRALGNIIHECCHYNFVPSKKANRQIGTLLSTLELSCFASYQKEHFSHHKYLGDILFDEDFKVRHQIGICNEKSFCLKGFIFIVLSPKNWFIILKSSIHLNFKNKIINLIRLNYVIIFFILCYFFTFKLMLLFVILPFITTYQMMKILSDFLDHGGLYFNEKREHKTRNHYFSFAILNWIFFPRNDCFHLTHHLYPAIPTTQLHEKHKILLKEKENYGTRRHCIF
ncbi:hypothetical protein GCL60_12815 [Silvanigrella paludirubra]|uniref:Fatty acid desaturase domain-containing protein n=2 Tax=Silvanigrella paludirubra TaxID=2499159 RepID=A0A6N6VSQ8_9BACT|nr:hypothetical protein GCL60_12815 [Silvanigrella paludirubra]